MPVLMKLKMLRQQCCKIAALKHKATTRSSWQNIDVWVASLQCYFLSYNKRHNVTIKQTLRGFEKMRFLLHPLEVLVVK